MKVTRVTLTYPSTKSSTPVKAFAKINFDGQLLVSGIKLLELKKQNGPTMILEFPELVLDKHVTLGETVTIKIVNPMNQEFRDMVTEAVLNAYNNDPYNPWINNEK